MPPGNKPTVGVWAVSGTTVALGIAHIWLLFTFAHSLGWVLALGLMTALCLKCSVDALRGRSLLPLLLMSAAMGVAHVYMVLGLPLGHGAHHSSGHQHSAAAGQWMLLVAVAEFALMFGCALLIRGALNRSQARVPLSPVLLE